jgi:hypothetical protein
MCISMFIQWDIHSLSNALSQHIQLVIHVYPTEYPNIYKGISHLSCWISNWISVPICLPEIRAGFCIAIPICILAPGPASSAASDRPLPPCSERKRGVGNVFSYPTAGPPALWHPAGPAGPASPPASSSVIAQEEHACKTKEGPRARGLQGGVARSRWRWGPWHHCPCLPSPCCPPAAVGGWWGGGGGVMLGVGKKDSHWRQSERRGSHWSRCPYRYQCEQHVDIVNVYHFDIIIGYMQISQWLCWICLDTSLDI